MKLKFWIGNAVSILLLAYFVKYIPWSRLWEVLKGANLWYLLGAVVLNIAFFAVRSIRWRYLLAPVKRGVRFGPLFSATMIGFMANNVLPGRLGEVARAYAIGRREDIPTSSAFASVMVERLFDTMSVLLLFIIVIAFMPERIAGGEATLALRKAGLISFGVYIVGVVFLGYLIYRPETLPRLLKWFFGFFSQGLAEKAASVGEKFVHGLGVVKEPRTLLLILFYSAIHWGLLWTPAYLLYKSLGFNFGVYESLYFLVVTCFSVAVPSTPGYVGVFEAATVLALVPLGLTKEQALGYALLAHFPASYIPVTALGLYYLYRENLSLRAIKKVEAPVA